MTVGELISLLHEYDPDRELRICRRFQFHDYYSPYEAYKHIRPHQDGLIIYEESDGS